jgi:hypothetical protein
MFEIDTGAEGGGSRGPWISFKPKGSAKHGLPYKSWAFREKTDTGSTIRRFTEIESPGIVLDIYAKGGQLCGSLKFGWAKSDGEIGKAPERRWNKSPLKKEPRPDESKTSQGGYVWRNALSVRAAISQTVAVTWEDEGWGGFKGFSALIHIINQGFATNEGLCPMVRCAGYVDEGSGTSATSVPIFEILKWVKRPTCLDEEPPAIEAAPPLVPTPAAARAVAVPDDAPF